MNNREPKYQGIIPLLSVIILTIAVANSYNLILGFPKGVDAYAHLTKLQYIIDHWPNFHWNHLWDSGVPLFGGTYPPLGYYLVAGFVLITGLPLELTLNFFSLFSYCINNIGLYYFINYFTKSRISALLSLSLLIFTPAYWSNWGYGGNYGRVLDMGFLGLSLFLVILLYNNPKHERIIEVALSLSLAAGLCTHLLFGLTSYLIIFVFLLFTNAKKILKIGFFSLGLSFFYVTQYFFSNASSSGLGKPSQYFPATLSKLYSIASIDSLNPLILPTILFLIGIIFYIKRRNLFQDLWQSERKISWVVALSLFLPFFTYAFIGHLPFYPHDLYVAGFIPDSAVGIFVIGAIMLIGLMFSVIESYFDSHLQLLRKMMLVYLVIIVMIGFLFNIDKSQRFIVNETDQNSRETLAKKLIVLNDQNSQQRFGTSSVWDSIWFNYIYDVPQNRDYYGFGIPYPNWHAWQEVKIWAENKNYPETNFLLDWYSIRWFSVGEPTYNYEKFLSKPEYYRYMNNDSNMYTFEYLKASKILYATNTDSLLLIGTEHYYDLFIRCLAQAGLSSHSFIPIKGSSSYLDDYTPSYLEKFAGVILYGYQYHERDAAYQTLQQYVEGGGTVFIEANGSPDFSSSSLPDPFPIENTNSVGLDNWEVDNVAPFISDLNYSRFPDLSYDGFQWGSAYSDNIKPWAESILTIQGKKVLVEGSMGKGRVIWSGINLFYLVLVDNNPEETQLVNRVLLQLLPEKSSASTHDINFINPSLREVNLYSETRGIIFKENYFPQWKSYSIYDDRRIEVEIMLAGPGLMYVPLDLEEELPNVIRFEYHLLPIEKIGYGISLTFLIIISIYFFTGFSGISEINPISWGKTRYRKWWKK